MLLSPEMREKIEVFQKTQSDLSKIIVIYGPTASGKTGLALEVATYLSSEIISADSRQVYRGLDIGTGKITKEEMRGISHHMLDVIDPSETFSMVDFATQSLPICESLREKGKIPIICGGTGLYIDSLLYEMNYPDTPPDWEYRRELEDIRAREGDQKLWDMLSAVDPEYARELLRENYRYVMRGLEVIRATGRSKRESANTKKLRFDPLFLTLYSDSVEHRKKLYENIDTRVSHMFHSGLIEEVEYNMNVFGPLAPGINTIGYKEVVAYLKGGSTLDETITLIQQHSRNYAKRQITWNKRYLASY